MTVPAALRARPRRASRVPAVIAGFAARLAGPARPVLARAAQIPLTIAAYGFLDSAAFLWNLQAGLVSTAVLLIVLEHQLADE